MRHLLLSILFFIILIPVLAISQTTLTWSETHQPTGGSTGIDCNSTGICIAALSTVGNVDVYLMRSTNMGTTWDTVYRDGDPKLRIYTEAPGEVAFLSDSVVLVQLDSAYVLRSADYGVSWQRHAVSSFNSGVTSHIQRVSSNKAICVVVYGHQGFKRPDTTFISHDGGINWTPTKTQPKLSKRTQEYHIQELYTRGEKHFGTIVYYSDELSTAIALTETSDDGETWEEILVPTPTRIGAVGVDITFFDENTGILTGFTSYDTALVMRTWDGGENWPVVFFGMIHDSAQEKYEGGMFNSSFLDTNYGIAGCRSGIVETNDGGYTWEFSRGRKWVPTYLSIVDRDNAVGVGNAGTLMLGTRDRMSVPYTSTANKSMPFLSVRIGESLSISRIVSYIPSEYAIFNLTGRKVYGGSSLVPTAPVQPGFYLLRISEGVNHQSFVRLLVRP